MTTTTLTTVASDYDCRIRHVWFNCRSSTPTTGSMWEGWGEWRVVRGGSIIKRENKVLDFAWCTKNDGDIVQCRAVDKAGNKGSWVSYTISVAAASTATARLYINGTTGNDSTGNGTSGSPWQTVGKLKTEMEALVASGAEIIGYVAGSATYAWGTEPGWDGGTTPCRVQFVWDGTGTKPLMTWTSETTGFSTGFRQSVVVEGFDLDGNYASGFAPFFSPERSGAGTRSACNSIFLNCDIHDWYQGCKGGDDWISADPATRRDTGDNEFLHLEDCSFSNQYQYHLWGMDYMRYFSIRNCTFGTVQNTPALILVRMYSLGDHYFEDVFCDHNDTASWRVICNIGTSAAVRYGSVVRFRMIGTDREANSYAMAASGDGIGYYHDVRFVDCEMHKATMGWGTNAHGGTNSVDVNRLQMWDCTFASWVSLPVSASGGTYQNLEFVQCSFVAATTSFAGELGLLFGTVADRYVDGGIRFVGNSIYWPGTGNASFGVPLAVFTATSLTRAELAAKFSECDYNQAGKVDGTTINWARHSDSPFNSSLASWQSATTHDDNSGVTNSDSFDFTNDGGSGTLDVRLTAGTGPLVGTGYPHAYWIDGDGYVHTDDVCGPYQYDTGSLTTPDDPSLGGPSGSAAVFFGCFGGIIGGRLTS